MRCCPLTLALVFHDWKCLKPTYGHMWHGLNYSENKLGTPGTFSRTLGASGSSFDNHWFTFSLSPRYTSRKISVKLLIQLASMVISWGADVSVDFKGWNLLAISHFKCPCLFSKGGNKAELPVKYPSRLYDKVCLHSTSYPPSQPTSSLILRRQEVKVEVGSFFLFLLLLTPHRSASLQFVEFLKMFRLLGWKENHRKITIRAALHF